MTNFKLPIHNWMRDNEPLFINIFSMSDFEYFYGIIFNIKSDSVVTNTKTIFS